MQRIALGRFFNREPTALRRGRLIASLVFSLFALTAFSCSQEAVSAKDKVLFDFETDSDLNRFAWKCRSRFEISSDFSNTGKYSLRFQFHPASRIGFSTGDVPHDWSAFKSLDFWVFNASGVKFPLEIQINRREGPSLVHIIERRIEIDSGPTKVSISLIPGDIGKIDGFYIFMREVPMRAELYFDTITLVRSDP
jgi:hypothetical protein